MTTDAPVSASRGPTLSGVGWCDDIALSSVRFGSYVPRMPLGPAGADLSDVPSSGGRVFRFLRGCI